MNIKIFSALEKISNISGFAPAEECFVDLNASNIYFFVVKILRINLSLLNLSPFFVLQISPTFPVAQIYLFTFSFIRRSHNATNNVEETMKP